MKTRGAAKMQVGTLKSEIALEKRDNPDFSPDHAIDRLGNMRRIEAYVNIRESAISVLASVHAIDAAQVAAADRFRRLWETMGGAGARAIDWRQEAVDGGRITDPISIHQMTAGLELKAARDALTRAHGEYAYRLVGYIAGQGYSIHDLTATRRERQTMTDNLRRYLDVLAGHWGLSTRR